MNPHQWMSIVLSGKEKEKERKARRTERRDTKEMKDLFRKERAKEEERKEKRKERRVIKEKEVSRVVKGVAKERDNWGEAKVACVSVGIVVVQVTCRMSADSPEEPSKSKKVIKQVLLRLLPEQYLLLQVQQPLLPNLRFAAYCAMTQQGRGSPISYKEATRSSMGKRLSNENMLAWVLPR